MKARNILAYLQKGMKEDTDVTLALENSEKEFEIVNINSLPGRKIIVVKLKEDNSLLIGDSIENQEERTLKEIKEEVERTPSPIKDFLKLTFGKNNGHKN